MQEKLPTCVSDLAFLATNRSVEAFVLGFACTVYRVTSRVYSARHNFLISEDCRELGSLVVSALPMAKLSHANVCRVPVKAPIGRCLAVSSLPITLSNYIPYLLQDFLVIFKPLRTRHEYIIAART